MLREHGATGAALLGREFSGYELTAHIADGGMGKVYRARRADGRFDRDVAVKISASGLLDDTLRNRFLQEQQILASLNHRFIAQLYDAGISDEGWPYIVMELVDGTPIDEHCKNLDLTPKVQLLMKICRALSFAHGQLIVHRDIKPSNVLVTAGGEPKLLDFGIAKLLSDSAPVTRAASLTPRYASPEQLLGKPAGVTSDVYQVGLLLAEVLHPDLIDRQSSLEDAIQRASGGGDMPLDPAISRTLPRELVSIVEQCVRSNPAERYEQISDVREDLENFLGGFPVSASGNSPSYRARKFVRRNLALLATATAALAAFAVSGTWYLQEVNAAREQAELEAATSRQVTDFLASLFRSTSPSEMQGEDITAGELLNRGLERLDEDLGDQPRVHAQLQSVLGAVYQDIGNTEVARDLLSRAYEFQERELGSDHPSALRSLKNMAALASTEGGLEEADRLYREVIAISSRVFGDTHEETLDSRSKLASVMRDRGDFSASAAIHREVVDGYRSSGRLGSARGIRAMNGLAISTFQSGDPQAAIPFFEQSLELSRSVLGDNHMQTVTAVNNMAVTFREMGQPEKALPYSLEAYERALDIYGPDHSTTVKMGANHSSTLRQIDRLDDARLFAERAHGTAMDSLPRTHPSTDIALTELGQLELLVGNFSRAETLLTELLGIEREHLGMTHMYTIGTQLKLATAVVRQGRIDEAIALVQQAVDLMHETQGPEHHETLLAEKQLAALWLEAGRVQAAGELLERILPGLIGVFGEDARQVQDTQALIAKARAKSGA